MGATQGAGAYYAVIPADVRYDKDLRPNAKLLYGELTSLCNATGYCWATNRYFAELFDLSESAISKLIAQLTDKGYISWEMAKTDKGSERRIYAGAFNVSRAGEGGVVKKCDTPLAKISEGGVVKKCDTQHLRIINNNNPYSPQGDDVVDDSENERETISEPPAKTKKEPTDYHPQWFEALWRQYPRHDGKKNAKRAWEKLKPDRETCRAMSDALTAAKKSPQWNRDGGAYIPHLSTWINQRRWEDQGVDPSQLTGENDGPGTYWAPDPEVTH